ncbi:MAG TPA: GTP-binding protein [Burkholderiales bacterium]|jgi:sulfate adenylyltransferase subunit 1
MTLLGELERNRALTPISEKGVLRFITCGSVDDGKSTLIGRLLHDTRAILQDQLDAVARASSRRGSEELDLSLLTDGLEAEREQGITIDVAYRYFSTGRRKFIIADTPGHEQYTRNMVTGASTAGAAVILLDARKGLLPQSKRHLYLAHLLGIREVIVAVNKMDLAGYAAGVFEALRAEFERFAASLAIQNLQFIPVSALRGDMVVERGAQLGWYQGPTLLEALEAVDVVNETAARPLRFPVQYVARGAGLPNARGYMGRIASGTLRPGDEVLALPSGRRTRVKGITVLDEVRHAAAAGDSVALLLADELDVSRGDMLADVARPPRAARAFEAKLCWLAGEPLAPQGRYLLKHTTRTVKAKVASISYRVDVQTLDKQSLDAEGAGAVRMNDIVHAALVLQQPLFVDSYAVDRATGAFVLVDETTHQTVAAGMIE